MLTRRPSPEDPQLQAVLQESAAYAASAASTFEDDMQAAMKQSVHGTGAPCLIFSKTAPAIQSWAPAAKKSR